jgi:hypothetical protein
MKTSKLIGLTGFLAVSLLAAACSAPSGTQAAWNNHDWVDRAETGASIHGGDVLVSNSARGGD